MAVSTHHAFQAMMRSLGASGSCGEDAVGALPSSVAKASAYVDSDLAAGASMLMTRLSLAAASVRDLRSLTM